MLNSLKLLFVLLLKLVSVYPYWPTPQPPPPTPSLGCCITDCYGRPDGNYQSCHGCQYFATCSGGYPLPDPNNPNAPTISFWDRQSCGAYGLNWDDNKKQCVYHPHYVYSETCFPHDECGNPQCDSLLPEPPCACEIASYVFALDGSGSISSLDFAASQNWLIDIVNNHIHIDSNVAALQFSSSAVWIHTFAQTQQPRTDIINNIGAATQFSSSTNIKSAVMKAVNALNAESNTQKIIILLTDGAHNTGGDPCDLAPPSDDGIRLVVVGLGGHDPTGDLSCLNPSDVIVISNFDFSVVTTELEDCDAICHG